MNSSPSSTTESATNRIDLPALAAELDAAGIPFVLWEHYVHIPSLHGCDVFSDGEIYIGTERIDADVAKALAIITRHRPHPGPVARGRHARRGGGILMFYCDECANEHGWMTGLSYSYGPCEVCEETRRCNDLPSQPRKRPPITNTPAPDAGHAAETIRAMADQLHRLFPAFSETVCLQTAESLYANIPDPYPDHGRMDAYAHGFNDGMDHMNHTRPARTDGTETAE